MSDPRTQFTSLKPYLTLPQLFSLTWLAYPIISLLFVAFRLHASSGSAQDAVVDAKSTLLASCRAAEKAATSAASLPRFLAQGTNGQIVDGVNGTLNAARGALVLSLTIMQGIVEFIVDMYRSTFLCFLELVVRGSLHLLIGASQEVTSFVQTTLQTIGSGLTDQVNVVNSAINSAIDVINGVGGIFGGGINIQPVSLNLDALANIQIPNTFAAALTELNSTIPTLDELREAVDNVIAIPFERVKGEINETFSGISFDASVLPVPQANSMSFCSSLDISVVDRLGEDLVQITKIAFILLIVLIFLMILGNCALEWWKYRTLMNNLQTTREAWVSDPIVGQQAHQSTSGGVPTVTMTDYNLLELHAATNHPLLMLLTNKLSALLRLSRSQHIHMRWFFAYIFHPPALACLLIGLFGLLSVQLQLAAIGPLANKYNGEVAETVSNFTVLIGDSINGSMQNDSIAYATAVNVQVDGIQTTINDGMFGWVEETTSALNNTLVTFYAEIQTAIDKVFGGTVLEQPIEQFMFCLIGTKVVAFENALTFLHDNLRVDLPRANENILMISQESMDEVARPVALAAVGDQNDSDGSSDGLVGRIVTRYVAALKKERTMFLVILALWGFVVLMAFGIIIYHSYIRPAMERRKKAQWHREARSFEASPWMSSTVQLDEKGGSFDRTPSPSLFSPPIANPPALGYSDSRRKRETSSWDDDSKPSTPASGDQSSGRKLIALGRKFRRGDTFILSDTAAAAPPTESGPSLWERARMIFRRKDEENDDWLAGSATQIKSITPLTPRLSKLISPPPHSAQADFPPPFQRKSPPPLLSVPKPPSRKEPSVTGIENYRFPPPPRVSPMPVPLHHGFARQVPSDLPRSPMDFLNVESAHARKSSQTLEPLVAGFPPPPIVRSQNPFATPYDTHEPSPFASAADRREVSPFADPSTPAATNTTELAYAGTTTTNPFLNPANNAFGRAI